MVPIDWVWEWKKWGNKVQMLINTETTLSGRKHTITLINHSFTVPYSEIITLAKFFRAHLCKVVEKSTFVLSERLMVQAMCAVLACSTGHPVRSTIGVLNSVILTVTKFNPHLNSRSPQWSNNAPLNQANTLSYSPSKNWIISTVVTTGIYIHGSQ